MGSSGSPPSSRAGEPYRDRPDSARGHELVARALDDVDGLEEKRPVRLADRPYEAVREHLGELEQTRCGLGTIDAAVALVERGTRVGTRGADERQEHDGVLLALHG